MQTPTIPLNPSSTFPPKSHHNQLKLLPKLHLLPQSLFYRPLKMASLGGFGFGVRSQVVGGGASASSSSCGVDTNGLCTLTEYVGKEGMNVGDDMVVLLHHIQYACKRIAALVASPFNSSLGKQNTLAGTGTGSGRDAPKPLDIVSVSFTLNELNANDIVVEFWIFLLLLLLLHTLFIWSNVLGLVVL